MNDGTEGKVISTTQMGTLLHSWGFVDTAFTTADLKKGRGPKNVFNETYGRTSCLYIRCKDQKARKDLQWKLYFEGLRYNSDYHLGSSTVEVTVRYFKGARWNE